MTLQTTDLRVNLTNPSASAGDQLAQAVGNSSLGKYMATTELVGGQVGQLFDLVTASQAGAGYTDYRCVALVNRSATDTALNASLFLVDPASGGTYSLGLDPVGIVDHNAALAQGTSVGTKVTAPAGVTFTQPTSSAVLAVGDLAPGKCVLVWIRCVITAATPGTSSDLVTLWARAETV